MTNREANRIKNILKIIEEYKSIAVGENGRVQPLSVFLSQYFRANRQMGSKDRKVTSRFIYNFFRLGNILKDTVIKVRLLIADYLCETVPVQESIYLDEFLGFNFSDCYNLSFSEKFEIIQNAFPEFNLIEFYSFKPEFSIGIESYNFYSSLFRQPLLWARIKRGKEKSVFEEFEKNQIKFSKTEKTAQAVSLINGISLDALECRKNGFLEIQDLSSQLTGNYFQAKVGEHWWDCCSGAGGKTLLLADSNPDIKILATDTRESILINLKKRLQLSGVKNFQTRQIDLTNDFKFTYPLNYFDGIISDVPCSGSGTWARTPEMLSFFSEKEISEFQKKQKRIAESVIPYLKPGKPLVYITCSVFKAENEEVIEYLSQKHGLEIECAEMIYGYGHQADNLFVARLIKRQ